MLALCSLEASWCRVEFTSFATRKIQFTETSFTVLWSWENYLATSFLWVSVPPCGNDYTMTEVTMYICSGDNTCKVSGINRYWVLSSLSFWCSRRFCMGSDGNTDFKSLRKNCSLLGLSGNANCSLLCQRTGKWRSVVLSSVYTHTLRPAVCKSTFVPLLEVSIWEAKSSLWSTVDSMDSATSSGASSHSPSSAKMFLCQWKQKGPAKKMTDWKFIFLAWNKWENPTATHSPLNWSRKCFSQKFTWD